MNIPVIGDGDTEEPIKTTPKVRILPNTSVVSNVEQFQRLSLNCIRHSEMPRAAPSLITSIINSPYNPSKIVNSMSYAENKYCFVYFATNYDLYFKYHLTGYEIK